MTKCSCYAYRENLVKECHNKKTGSSEKETAALMEKNKLDECHMEIIKALGRMEYAGKSHIMRYMEYIHPAGDKNTDLTKKLKQLCDYGIVLSVCYYPSDNPCGYRTCNIYSLTGGGRDIFTGTGENRRCQGSYTPLREMDSRDGIKGVLNRAAFNSFYVSSLSYNAKYYFSYHAGSAVIEGRLMILSDKYSEGLVNVCVIPVRNMEGSDTECVLKIRAAQEHFSQKRIKKLWFVLVCEDDAHERELYSYLMNCKTIEKAVICMTKDTYLVRNDADAFDNITTYTQNGKELVSEFKKIIF